VKTDSFDRYIAAKQYLDSLSPKFSQEEIDDALLKIEEHEFVGPTRIVLIPLMSRKQLIAHYQKIEKGYKENFRPYTMRTSKWHRLKIPTLVWDNNTLPKNHKSIVRHALDCGMTKV
jgi:hypothetical protein